MGHMTSAADLMLRIVLGAAILSASIDVSVAQTTSQQNRKKYQESAECSSGHVQALVSQRGARNHATRNLYSEMTDQFQAGVPDGSDFRSWE